MKENIKKTLFIITIIAATFIVFSLIGEFIPIERIALKTLISATLPMALIGLYGLYLVRKKDILKLKIYLIVFVISNLIGIIFKIWS